MAVLPAAGHRAETSEATPAAKAGERRRRRETPSGRPALLIEGITAAPRRSLTTPTWRTSRLRRGVRLTPVARPAPVDLAKPAPRSIREWPARFAWASVPGRMRR